jgi:hypothetical protein
MLLDSKQSPGILGLEAHHGSRRKKILCLAWELIDEGEEQLRKVVD